LYEIDSAGLPQISQEGVDIINAVFAGLIVPGQFDRNTPIPKNIETDVKDLIKMFDLKNAPPGFEDIRFPGSEEEEKYDPSTDPTLNGDDFNQGDFGPTTDDFDPTAVALTDGSLQQELALGMQNAVDEMRERVGQSIEQIMLEQVNNQPDGLGPCTTVDCLLRASVEAARIFIFEKQMQ
jgi:hypothetical protein